MPIWFVIMERKDIMPMFVPVWHVIESIAATLNDINELYQEKVIPLQHGTNRQVQVMYFYREPYNPFKEEVK